MSVEILKKEKCVGCYACYNVCSKGCISMKPDFEGFTYPKVDSKKCSECGMCENVCPAIHIIGGHNDYKTPKIIAAWSLNEKNRIQSTSGGLFSEFALQILNDKGYVCGARYGADFQIEHCVINKIEDLYKIRQSKYAQSDINLVFREIKQLLVNGETVLFCGAPCQSAGLINYLGNKFENLYIIDFICRGANSPKVFAKFLEYLRKKYNSEIARVWFKNKTYGWNRFCTKVEFVNGESYLRDRNNDWFMRGYIGRNLYMRPSCEHCQYKRIPRATDVTIADFWGIKFSDPKLDIEKGVSLVMINSLKGFRLFEKIRDKVFYEEREYTDVLKGNPFMLTSPKFDSKRNYFFKKLEKIDFDKLIKKCEHRSALEFALSKAQKGIKKLMKFGKLGGK